MKKDDMIRKILRSFEFDFFNISRPELDQKLKVEQQRLSEQTYSEVEKQYYATA